MSLKQVSELRGCAIVIKDMVGKDGKGGISVQLIHSPDPIAAGEEFTPAQAFGGHCFMRVNEMLKEMCETPMRADELVTPSLVDEKFSEAALSAHNTQQAKGHVKVSKQGMRIHPAQPNEQFKTPTIITAEEGDLKHIKHNTPNKR